MRLCLDLWLSSYPLTRTHKIWYTKTMTKYKCLAKNCNGKLEKKYLFCSIECACYGGFNSGCQVKGKARELFRKIRRTIIYKIHMLIRNLKE